MKQYKIRIERKYLIVPVGDWNATCKKDIRLYLDGKLEYDFFACLDYVNPVYHIYQDVSKYIGKELVIEVSPEAEFRNLQSDVKGKACEVEATRRPKLLYTPEFGWNNDPNGLVRYTSNITGEIVWHMFYQYNPYDICWGNMCWGHATSRDLIHWDEQEVALWQDELGAIFSGSAVVDKKNVTGFKSGDEDPIVLFYTAAGDNTLLSKGAPFTQCIAYSTDGGKTFTKYEKNPIIKHIAAANRDPKVVWSDELGKYILALYLDGNEYCLFVSDNLIDWTEFQRITLECDGECPDLFKLPVNGDKNNMKWVLRGASHNYQVFDIENGKFRKLQDSVSLRYGGNSYASQTFSNVDDRVISISWEAGIKMPDLAYGSQMSYPSELTLKYEEGKYILCSNPVKEVNDIEGDIRLVYDIKTGKDNANYITSIVPGAYDVTIELGDFKGKADVRMFGRTFTIDADERVILYGDYKCPIYGGADKLRFIMDSCSVCFTIGDGRLMWNVGYLCDYNLRGFSITSDSDSVIKKLTLKKLDV